MFWTIVGAILFVVFLPAIISLAVGILGAVLGIFTSGSQNDE